MSPRVRVVNYLNLRYQDVLLFIYIYTDLHLLQHKLFICPYEALASNKSEIYVFRLNGKFLNIARFSSVNFSIPQLPLLNFPIRKILISTNHTQNVTVLVLNICKIFFSATLER